MDIFIWLRDSDSHAQDIWAYILEIARYYWDTHPVYLIIGILIGIPLLLVSNDQLRYFGNQIFTQYLTTFISAVSQIIKAIFTGAGHISNRYIFSAFMNMIRSFGSESDDESYGLSFVVVLLSVSVALGLGVAWVMFA